MDPKCVIKCVNPTCEQLLSVPTGLGTIKIRCVQCKTQWTWSPEEDAPEMRELPFRCALTGKRFNVAFGRYHRNHKYRVVHVSMAPTIEAPSTPPPTAQPLLTKFLGPFHLSVKPAPSTPPPTARPLLTKFLGPFHLSAKPAPLPKPAPASRQNFDAREFDFGGWYCPCCGYSHDVPTYPQFVRCGTCKEYVCCARVTRVSLGIETFECHDGCKGGGRITGQIETFDGSPISASSNSAAKLKQSEPESTSVIQKSDSPNRIGPSSDQTLLGG